MTYVNVLQRWLLVVALGIVIVVSPFFIASPVTAQEPIDRVAGTVQATVPLTSVDDNSNDTGPGTPPAPPLPPYFITRLGSAP